MTARRGATGLSGILAIDKPAGMTSHDVVAAIRRATGEGRIGHAGTLDPAATGLLVVLLGPSTRLERYLSGNKKRYEATIAFGAETDTDDAEGAVVREAEVDPGLFEPARAQTVLDGFLGPQLQQPPAYSAIKAGGRVAHRAARAGETLDLAPRAVEVFAARLLAVDPDARTWRADFSVSKGTYIRALARDIGRAVASAAHLAALRRTASGALSLADAHTLSDVLSAAARGALDSLMADPVVALELPVLDADAHALRHGRALPAPPGLTADLVAVRCAGELRGVYRLDRGILKPETVIAREADA